MSSLDAITRKVIGAAYTVHNSLGFGFLESVYENALSVELRKEKIRFTRQVPVRVWYDQTVVGDFLVDILIEKRLIVELKSVTQLVTPHEVQLVNYLTATRIDHGLLINFAPIKVEVRRKFRTFTRTENSRSTSGRCDK